MDDEEWILSPEMIFKYQDWVSEIESLAGPILKYIEKLIEMNETQRLATAVDGSNHIPDILLMMRKYAGLLIGLAPKTAEPLQSPISFQELYSLWFKDVRSSLGAIFGSVNLLKDILSWKNLTDNRIEGNDSQKRTFEKLVRYADFLEFLARDPELYHNQLPRVLRGPDTAAFWKSLHDKWNMETLEALGEMPANVFIDLDWVHRHEQELLENYGRRSILVYNEKVIGVGNTYSAALEDAEHNLPPDSSEITPVTYELHYSLPFIRIGPKPE